MNEPTVSERDVKEMRLLAGKLKEDFDAWIEKNHPGLKR